jgi:bacterioferritin
MTMPVRTPKEDQRRTAVVRGDKPASTTPEPALIEGLNHDLGGEYRAILMYTHYSAKLTGPYRRELRALFQAEIGDEQGHAQFLADKIAALGGEPTTQPRPVPYANQPREMLEQALAAEKQAIADYNARIGQAEAFGPTLLQPVAIGHRIVASEYRATAIEVVSARRPYRPHV